MKHLKYLKEIQKQIQLNEKEIKYINLIYVLIF